MSTTAYKISVMQAHERGEKVECRNVSGAWEQVFDPFWDWVRRDYRIAPKPLECYVLFNLSGVPLYTNVYKDRLDGYVCDHRIVKMREVTDE